MESDRRKIEETYLKAVDIGYSYRLAKKMEEFKSNPVLGYRTAGSKAEFDTGEFLKAEMERIGLSDIHKDELCLDSWEFEKAVMRFTDRDGEKHEIQLGAYQTEFVTDGWKEYPLVYAGRGDRSRSHPRILPCTLQIRSGLSRNNNYCHRNIKITN